MRQALLILGGVVAGVLVVLGISAARDDDGPMSDIEVELSFPAITHDESAAQALVVAWDRWRTATFVSQGTWTRTLDGSDEPLSGETYTAQIPPRRVVVRLGTTIESVDGEESTCDAPSEEVIVPGCAELAGSLSYDDRVRAEMSLVLNYVIGESRIYDVGNVDGCFQVELTEAALRSPWGRAAEFCFDEESGALRSSKVRRQTAIDVEENPIIRVEVTDADFP